MPPMPSRKGRDGHHPPPPPTVTARADCSGASGLGDVFSDVAGFTATPKCPVDVDSAFADPEFLARFSETAAAEVAKDASPIVNVFVGRLDSGSGDAFVSTFLSDLSAKAAHANPPKTVATSALDLGGHPAQYFNVPLAMDGYLAARGSVVAIAYKAAGAPEDSARDAMDKVLANLPR